MVTDKIVTSRKVLVKIKNDTENRLSNAKSAIKHLDDNKAVLLLVLERSEVPLHNNDIREYVKRRKVSGIIHTESGVFFWEYLLNRLFKGKKIPPYIQTHSSSRKCTLINSIFPDLKDFLLVFFRGEKLPLKLGTSTFERYQNFAKGSAIPGEVITG